MAERTCILSGKSLPRDRLIRFVAGPEGHAVVDLAEKLPGRGAWVTARTDDLATAIDEVFVDIAAPRKSAKLEAGKYKLAARKFWRIRSMHGPSGPM